MTGLGLLNPWGLAALAGIAVVGVIYLFYERYREKRITGLFLWDAPEGWREGGRRLARPRATRSLLLDLLAAGALALAVAAPAWTTRTGKGVVVILDASLSMRALDNHEKARDLASGLLSSAGGAGSVLLLQAGDATRVLAGPDVDPAAARAALAGYDPYDTSSGLNEALRLARELVTGHADIHVITDRDVDLPLPASSTLTTHVLEARAPNPAIIDAARHPTATGESLLVVVAGYADAPVTGRLVVEAGTRVLDEATLSLQPSEITQIDMDLPPDAGPVEISLVAKGDALVADSNATLLPEPPGVVTYAVDLPDAPTATSVRKALRAAGALASGEDEPDLLVTSDPEAAGAVLTLRIPVPGEQSSSLLGPFVVDRAHVLCRDVDLTGVYWTTDDRALRPDRITPLVTVGDRPLYHAQSPDTLVLSLDPSRSNIARTPAWPVLLSNLVLYAASRLPGLHRASYRPGDVPEYVPYSDPERDPVSIEGEGVELPWRNLAIPPRLPSRPGIYALVSPSGRDVQIAVNAIAPAESDLGSLSTQTFDETRGETGLAAGATQVLGLGWLMVLLAVLALLANWLLDRRRRT